MRAALAIQRELADINARNFAKGEPELSARIGLESGPVVVEVAGEVFGDAPNIAARVQGAADPGSVLITANVQRQVAGLFVVEDRGPHEVEGASTPVALYRVVRASGGRRFGARALTPLVGREEELDLFGRRWERAARGEGQFVQIVGEPGIGKSRLVEEFRARLGGTPHTFVEWSSSQLLQYTPLHPSPNGVANGSARIEPADRRLADLESTLRLIGLDPAEHAPLIAPLVDIPLPEERAAKLPPEELRRRQLAAMTAWVLAGARSQVVALAFEDLHWADPTTLEALAERGAQAPLLILTTTRPEFRPPWSLRSHHSVISLSPLDRADVGQMVGELAARHALSTEVVEGVSERTGGVPLSVEEVTRLLLERGEAAACKRSRRPFSNCCRATSPAWRSARSRPNRGRLGPRFYLYPVACGRRDRRLRSPVGARQTRRRGPPHRRGRRIARKLSLQARTDPGRGPRQPAQEPPPGAAPPRRANPGRTAGVCSGRAGKAIAHHFTQAGLDELAIEWWGKAGDQALRRSAFQEAIAHLGKAIAMADKAPETKAEGDSSSGSTSTRPMAMHSMAARGYTAPETINAFTRARASAAGDTDTLDRFRR